MAFPIVKIGNKNPPNSPFPLAWRGPHLIQQCLGPPHAPPQTAAPTVEAHRRRKVPIKCNGALQMCPQKYPLPWTDPQTPLSASSLDPSDLWCQTASGSDPPFFHNALDRQADRQTERPTDRSRVRLTTIGRCASRATRPNNNFTDRPTYRSSLMWPVWKCLEVRKFTGRWSSFWNSLVWLRVGFEARKIIRPRRSL